MTDEAGTGGEIRETEQNPAAQPDLQDLQDTIDDLMVHLHEAKSVPLSGNAIVDREQFLGMLEKLRTELPDEL
ncbi:MAG: hypothetical protein WEF28_14395, partial [Acidimicrobiia bacterium]